MFWSVVTLFAGFGAGAFGALLGLGGGVFLVPILNLVVGLPYRTAAAISLTTVVATSSFVSLDAASRRFVNPRLAVVLLTHSVLGASFGRVLLPILSDEVSGRIFGVTAVAVAVLMLLRLGRRNIMSAHAHDLGHMGGRFFDVDSGMEVGYRVRRVPLALGLAFVAGVISTVVGVGGGVLLVPALNSWCGVPLRAAAATSALMIGVTAVPGVVGHYVDGHMTLPVLEATAVLGVLAGSRAGFWVGARSPTYALKLTMIAVLLAVGGRYLMVR